MSKSDNGGRGKSSDVGYRKPPNATQFRPGQSGNPKGRPKGGVNVATLLKSALTEIITVTVDGQSRRMSKMNAALIQLANKAVKGDARALQQVLNLTPLIEGGVGATASALRSDADKEVLVGILGRLYTKSSDEPTSTTQPIDEPEEEQ